MRKSIHRGLGVSTILPIDPTYIIRNIALLRKTNKLLQFSHINAKYLIIVNNFLLFNAALLAIKCNTETMERRVTSQSNFK